MLNGKQGDLISILMPTYNVAPFVTEAVRSILGQTWQHIELIIVDDCSTDGTYEILNELVKTDSRIKLFRNEVNSKICITLNRAWKETKGEYIARMDGDDVSEPERLDVLITYLKSHPNVDLVGSQLISIRENGETLSYKECLRTPEYITQGNQMCPCVSHCWMAKRSVYEKLNGYRNIPYVEDYDFLLRGAAAGFHYANVEEYLHRIRIRDGNTGSTNGLKQRKAKSFVQQINAGNEELNEADLAKRFVEAISFTDSEQNHYLKAHKHLDIAIQSRRNPLKLVYHVLVGMAESKYISKYMLEAVRMRLLIRRENKEIPRTVFHG